MEGVLREGLIVLIAYLIGGVPFSYLIARWRKGVDLYECGEGNVGARNVYHVVGPQWGILAGLLDIGKGALACLVGQRLAMYDLTVLCCGIAAPLGHGFSPFLRFRGGKGVATTLGFLFKLYPQATAIGGVLIGIGYAITRDMNKAFVVGIPAVIVLPPLFGAPWWSLPYALGLFLLLAWKKMIDRAHEQEVWARSPWEQGEPGFHREAQ